MPPSICRSLAVAAFIPFSLLAFDAFGQIDWLPTSVEVVQLPKFCWGQFKIPNADGDEFKIRDCGPSANHYCQGLVYLIRSKGPAAKGKPLSLIQRADVAVAYTESGIAGYPKCSIREHVDSTRAEVNNLLRVYGGKPVGTKRP